MRLRMARVAGVLKNLGSIEVAMILAFKCEQDPIFMCRRQHLEMFVKLYRGLPSGQRATLEKVWIAEWNCLGTVKCPWMHVKGPVKAMAAILKDLEWLVPGLSCWVDEFGDEFPCQGGDPYSVCCLWKRLEATILRQQAKHVAASSNTLRLSDGFDVAVVRKKNMLNSVFKILLKRDCLIRR